MISDDVKREFLVRFGKRLNKIRKSKGLSYRKLATLCETIDHSYISKIEKGEANITLETILELLIALGASPRDLFDFEIQL
ncbi:XRE family transcriptional regulator [Flavobacterium cupreum]|uniref:XRE family transcriptional regulator n=1 Tax=Flavobacterium cupreum TaxID=2133766 RepID=A0A434A2B1_9FLAO|nr:helix-turn-helix transcriptional regulator [Flavobacterium cupreum]RUT68492.1 XRE family transcriptional regulator [Flavobacterium cupreum]